MFECTIACLKNNQCGIYDFVRWDSTQQCPNPHNMKTIGKVYQLQVRNKLPICMKTDGPKI